MNLSAANHGVSMGDRFYPNASPLSLNGTGNENHQISQSPPRIYCNLCNLRNLWIKSLFIFIFPAQVWNFEFWSLEICLRFAI